MDRNKVFLYKNNSDDRDCCAYIDSNPMRFECDHYFGGVVLHGSCYSNHKFAPYQDIETILTEGEYQALITFNENIGALGYGITKGDDRYNRGIQLCKEVQPIFNKLLSEENKEMFKNIQAEERKYLMTKFKLNESEVEDIFNHYYLEYKDRSVVIAVFDDTSDLGYEEAFSLGYIDFSDSIQSKYFNYEKFGEDLLEEDQYHQLDDGRIVYLSY
jgi:hypothetical protein